MDPDAKKIIDHIKKIHWALHENQINISSLRNENELLKIELVERKSFLTKLMNFLKLKK